MLSTARRLCRAEASAPRFGGAFDDYARQIRQSRARDSTFTPISASAALRAALSLHRALHGDGAPAVAFSKL